MQIREFWEEDPNLLWAYRKSYTEKIEMEKEITNFNCWLQGVYIFDALDKSLYNHFNRGNKPPIEYMRSPIDFSKTKEDIEREKQQKLEEQIRKRNEEIKEMLKK